jgi:hypothetical protein
MVADMSGPLTIAACILLCGSAACPALAADPYCGLLLGAVTGYSDIEPLTGTPTTLVLRTGLDMGSFGTTGLALECDGMTTISRGGLRNPYDSGISELTDAELEALARHWSWKLSSMALYSVARLGEAATGRMYFKIKAGIIHERMTVDTGVVDAWSNTAISAGLGIGAELGRTLRLEMELVTVDESMAHIAVGLARAF